MSASGWWVRMSAASALMSFLTLVDVSTYKHKQANLRLTPIREKR